MSEPTDYEFDERKALSQGISENKNVRDILLENIPGAVNAIVAHQINDRQGTDWWVEHQASKFISVDCKVRSEDWAATHPDEDDLALETYSVVESDVCGWTRDKAKRTDYVLWLWIDSGRWCLVPFPMLCAVFEQHWKDWRLTYKRRRQRTPWKGGSYLSECVFVPRRIVWAEIYKRYAGQLVTHI